jgi:cell division transport system permease protein
MVFFVKKAVADIIGNRFLSSITVLTISFLVLMVGAFILVVTTSGNAVESWKHGIRMMVYLKPVGDPAVLEEISKRILAAEGVKNATFISKERAFSELKQSMKRQSGIFERLEENPLPDAFEVSVASDRLSFDAHLAVLERIAREIEKISSVDEIEYGRLWLRRMAPILQIIRFAGFGITLLFFVCAGVIISNTIRLVLFSRSQEIEILRLVGATNGFIRLPFLIEAGIVTVLGAMIGLGFLFAGYKYVVFLMEAELPGLAITFLSFGECAGILFTSLCVGETGCYLALRQYSKK